MDYICNILIFTPPICLGGLKESDSLLNIILVAYN